MEILSLRQKRKGVKMENKLVKIAAVLTVVGLMAAGPVAYAVSEGDNPESGKGSQIGESKGSTEGLDLTPEQKEKLKALQDPTLQEPNKVITEQMKIKMQALYKAAAEPGAMRADVSDLIEELSALYAKMLSYKMDRLFSMKEILTPEQFEKMQEQDKGSMDQKPGGFGGQNPGPDQN